MSRNEIRILGDRAFGASDSLNKLKSIIVKESTVIVRKCMRT
jgi:hypothetical protein